MKKSISALGIEITEADIQQIIGRPPKSYIGHFDKKYIFDEDKFGKLQEETYYELFGHAPMFDDAVRLVKKLKCNGYRVGLVTGSNNQSNEIFLKKAGLEDTFDTVVTLEMYQKTKPDPESYLLGAKNLALSPSQCIAIEDSERGLQAAKNAGIKCIVIPNKETRNQDFSLADTLVSSATNITFDLLASL